MIGVAVCGFAALMVLLGAVSRSLQVLTLEACATAAVVAGLVYVGKHREWTLAALILADQLLAWDLLPKPMQSSGHYLLAAALALPLIPYLKRSGILSKGGFKLYVMYFCLAAITVLYSLDPTVSLGRLLLAILGFVAVSATAVDVHSRTDVIKVFERVAMACGAVLLICGLFALLLPHDLTWGFAPTDAGWIEDVNPIDTTRFKGIFGTPNQLGMLALISAASALICWPTSHGWKKWMLSGILISALGFTVMADSRTALVALTVGVALYVMWRYRLRGVLICFALMVLLSSAATQLIHPDGRVGEDRDVSTFSGRTAAWQYAIQKVKERPFTGYGYAVEGTIFLGRDFHEWWGPWEEGAHISLHDGYLSRLIDLGIPLSLLWAFIILRPWIWLFRRREDPWNLKPIALILFVPILVHNLTESSATDFAGLIGLAFGLGWAMVERRRLLSAGEKSNTAGTAFDYAPEAAEPFAYRASRSRFNPKTSLDPWW
jgi:hypothetical protein